MLARCNDARLHMRPFVASTQTKSIHLCLWHLRCPSWQAKACTAPRRRHVEQSRAPRRVRRELLMRNVCIHQTHQAETQKYSIVKLPELSSAEGVELLWRAAQLHSEVFHVPPAQLPPLAAAYAAQSLGLQLLTYLMQGSNHLTLLAFWGAPGTRLPAGGSGTSGEAHVEPQGAQVVGTVNASLRTADEVFSAALGCRLGTRFILITNMAVTAAHRGRGLGRQLLHECVDQALRQFQPSAESLVLMVYQDNSAALHLYRSCGFTDTRWVDPRWLKDAEKGRVGRARRQLMIRQLA